MTTTTAMIGPSNCPKALHSILGLLLRTMLEISGHSISSAIAIEQLTSEEFFFIVVLQI